MSMCHSSTNLPNPDNATSRTDRQLSFHCALAHPSADRARLLSIRMDTWMQNQLCNRADMRSGVLLLFLFVFPSYLTHLLFSSCLISQGIQNDQSNPFCLKNLILPSNQSYCNSFHLHPIFTGIYGRQLCCLSRSTCIYTKKFF